MKMKTQQRKQLLVWAGLWQLVLQCAMESVSLLPEKHGKALTH